LTLICNKLGINLILATPHRKKDEESFDQDVDKIIKSSPYIQHEEDPRKAVRSADFVYTDTWVDMQYFNDPQHRKKNAEKIEMLKEFQVNKNLLQGLKCKIMHDMPIHDGYEITDEMVRDSRSIIFEQAENRLHAQKGLLWWLSEKAGETKD
jgi:ornithine carbamoyltransferase